ncbi:MAG: glycosyltransferase [Candidatus Electrothrix sp. AX5]|nr:glycosyltransferase [Candidatus Electrothrix sp. AX5]
MQQYDCDTLIATAPPFSVLLTCCDICAQFNLKFIPDFRDAWSQWVITPYASYIHYRMTLYYERKILKQAYKIITATPQLKNDFLEVHPNIQENKFSVILNSISSEIKYLSFDKIKNKFIIGYVGSFYYNPVSHCLIYSNWWKKKAYQWVQYVPRKENWFYRSPYFFFKIINELFDHNPSLKEKVFFYYVGNTPDWLIEMVNNFKLNKNVLFLGFKPKDQVRKFIEKCDAMLATSIKIENSRDYCIAGKTFDYLAAGKPIIAVVNNGDQKDMLLKSGTSIILDPDDKINSSKELLTLIENRSSFNPNYQYIKSFRAEENTKLLANLINS